MKYIETINSTNNYTCLCTTDVQVPNIINLFKEKYTIGEIEINKVKCIDILLSRINVLDNTFRYLLQKQYIKDIFSLEYSIIDFDNMLQLYNSILLKEYNNEKIDNTTSTLIYTYKVNYLNDFKEKLLIDSRDVVIQLYESITYDYKCCLILMEKLTLFFNTLIDDNKSNLNIKNMFFSFLYCQYEYIFYIFTLNSLLQYDLNKNYIKNYLFINSNIHRTATLLSASFNKSNKGLYKEAFNIEDPFLSFADGYRRELVKFLMDPNSNRIDFFNLLEQKYNVFPISTIVNNNDILFLTENMISFEYLHDFINSYIRTSSNLNWHFLSLLLDWQNKLAI